jgi:hypothetical protein
MMMNMYVYMYVCMYTYIYIYIYIHVYTHDHHHQHEIGSRIHLQSDPDGLFGNKGTLGNFEASLKGVPDLVDYIGTYIYNYCIYI